jgi:hypothetical protein
MRVVSALAAAIEVVRHPREVDGFEHWKWRQTGRSTRSMFSQSQTNSAVASS